MNKLFLDIETSPLVVESWNLYPERLSYESIRQPRAILCGAWSSEGSSDIEYTDQFTLKNGQIDDTANCNNLYHTLVGADVLVMHNGDKFDLPIIRTHLLERGFPPIPPIKTIDTLKLARKYFKFSSNRLDHLGETLGVGRKIKTEYRLWQEVMNGNKQALQKMVDYNIQDVELLKRVYYRMAAWFGNEVRNNTIASPHDPCPSCGSTKGHQSRGWGKNIKSVYRRYQCKSCRAWNRGTNKRIMQ